MNRTNSEEIYNIKRFTLPSQQLCTSGRSFQQNGSFMERDFLASSSNERVLDARSRFEEVFFSSPRAQELYSSVGPKSQKVAKVKSFDDLVKMAESIHNKSSNSTSVHSLLADQSLAMIKPKTPVSCVRNDKFEISPFKSSVNDSAIKKKVSMVISKLEDEDNTAPSGIQTGSKKVQHVEGGVSKDSGFNEVPSVSAGRSEGTFTNIINRDTSVVPASAERKSANSNSVASAVKAQTANSGEEVHLSFDDRDREVDVVNEDDNENVEKTNGEDDDNCVDENNNASTKSMEKTSVQSLNSSTELGEGQEQKSSRLNVLKLWSLKAIKTRTHMGIIVEGQRSDDPVGELWHSTAIVSRVNERLVQTKSGSQYKLMGPINEHLTLQQGFSPEFVKSFKNGFPSNWLSLVSDHFNSQSSSESEDEKRILDQPVKNDKRPTSKKIKRSIPTGTPSESKVKIKGKVTALKTPENRQLPKEVEMKTTRSGRMVKPPLAWWRGQRILTDRYHNLEGIDPGGQEHTPISPMYNMDIKLPIKSKKSSPFKQGPFLSDDDGKRVRSSHKKKSQQTLSSVEESDISLSQKKGSSKQPTGAKNSAKDGNALRSPNKATSTNKSQQVLTDQNKVESSSAVVERVRNSSQSEKPKDDVAAQNASYAFEESCSSDGSSERDIVQNLKKKLFYSPKKSPSKSQNVPVQLETREINCEDKKSGERIEDGASKNKNGPNGEGSPRKGPEPAASEDDLPNNVTISKKNTSADSVLEEDIQNNRKRKTSANVHVDCNSEDVKQQPAPKIPSPSKRVLRSQRNKSNSLKNEETSDADSEYATRSRGKQKRLGANLKTSSESERRASSCEEQSDNSRHSGKTSKAASKKRNAQKRVIHQRVQTLVNEATTQSSEEDSDEMPRKPLRKSQAHQKLAKTNTVTRRDSGKGASGKNQTSKASKNAKDGKKRQDILSDETPWEDEEIERLNEALFTIPGNTPMFWQKISRKVASRTAQECQLKHQGHMLVSNKKETLTKKTSAKEKNAPGAKGQPQQNVKVVSGGVGTIKRKREIRELLEQQDVNYEDDIFDATPFKKKKDFKLPFNLNSNSSDEVDDEEEEESESERGMSHKTPSSRTPSSRFRPLGPLSTTTTPSSEFISPSLLQQVNRKDMDHYIYRMQQGKRGTQAHGKLKSKPMRTSTPKKPALSSSHFPVVSSELFEAHPASDHDSAEGDDDYYFSDE